MRRALRPTCQHCSAGCCRGHSATSPHRRPLRRSAVPVFASSSAPRTVRSYVSQRPAAAIAPAIDLVATEVAYEAVDWKATDASKITDALYDVYTQCSRSACRARRPIRPNSFNRRPWLLSRHRKPSYRPHLPASVVSGRHPLGRPIGKHHLCRRGAFRISRRFLDASMPLLTSWRPRRDDAVECRLVFAGAGS